MREIERQEMERRYRKRLKSYYRRAWRDLRRAIVNLAMIHYEVAHYYVTRTGY